MNCNVCGESPPQKPHHLAAWINWGGCWCERRKRVQDIILSNSFVADNGCWIWIGKIVTGGYGGMGCQRSRKMIHQAHRCAFVAFREDIPNGLHLDHECKNVACVNPWHLKPRTPKDHKARHTPTHCKRGHEFTPENIVHWRGVKFCRTCTVLRRRKRTLQDGAKKAGQPIH